MGAFDNLRQALKATNAQAFQGLVFEHKKLDKEVQKLKTWLGTNGTAKPPSNLIRDALVRFYQAPKAGTLRDTRLVSYGCVDPFGEHEYRLIDDANRFPKLLDCVERYRNEPRPFRRCYKGLLNAYFTYDPEAEWTRDTGKKNWETLRTYLHDRSADLQDRGVLPDWVHAVAEHKNLLTANPCGRYGLSLLKQENEEFAEARQKLEISEASWVTTRLVLAQIAAATELSDGAFGAHISRLLDLLDRHQVVLNTGLAQILIHYHGCASSGVHPELRDFSVSRWGNPWLSSNSARWDQVPRPTRAMVADWLKLELIHKFFNVLAEDGSSDTRRLKFWQRYHKHIDDMYFALGRRAARNKGGDFVELRRQMQGRVLGLKSAGPPENNAFIMCMGDYVVVEFGIKGNACFIFRRNELPFALSGNVAGDTAALKSSSNVERLLHIDRSYRGWERTFETTLTKLLSVRPAVDNTVPVGVGISSGRASAAAAPPVQRGNALLQTTVTPSAITANYTGTAIDRNYSRREFERFCAVRRFRVRDLTHVGGNLWVVTDNADESVARQLQAWGFTYKQDRGWWRKVG